MSRLLRLLTIVAAFASTRSAGAQIMSNPTQWYVNNQIYSMRVFNSAVANSMVTRGAGAPGTARPAAPVDDPTVFREQATSTLPSLLSGNSTGISRTPAEARQLFEGYIALYRQTARKDGFPSNDLAYAFEYFVVNNFQIVHDLVDVPYEKDPRAKKGTDGFDRITIMSQKKLLQVTPAQERAVFTQFRTRLADNAGIRRMTDAQKQEAAELMATMFGINFAAYMKAIDSGNAAELETAHAMARQGLEKLLGVPMARIRITNSGLEL
ncbi:MAG: hypothetical protein H7099_07945 [Gemmatimonadaceae bacterium]|nr:hypothetical protein [Gemmatimonadaceae bacterium]